MTGVGVKPKNTTTVKTGRTGGNDRKTVKKSVPGTSKRTRQTTLRSNPPVLVRNSNRGTSSRIHAAGRRPKRRFDLSLNSSGAEMRLPSIPMINMGWRWVSFVAAGGLLFLLYYLMTSPAFRVEAAEIHGLRRVPDMMVHTSAKITGEQIFTLSATELEGQLLSQFPEFSDVQASLGLPNTVVISVTERVPTLTWILNGDVRLVDEDGMAFPMRTDSQDYPLPVVESQIAPPVPQLVSVESIQAEQALEDQAVADQAPEQELSQINETGAVRFVSQDMVKAIKTLALQAPEEQPLIYDPEHGLGWTDPRGWEVYFGDATEIEIKLLVYGAIVGRLQQEGIQPVLISVQYPHAPFYRLER